ncbi:MAG: hypothetical protein J6Y72_10645 [Bacteroidales bacterium]|nr:hypothetical protein [Bacteroidales bacterium]
MKYITTIAIATLLSVTSYAQRLLFDSQTILTSTSFAIGYEDLVSKYVAEGLPIKSAENVFQYLENKENAIGGRLAVICAWGWSPYFTSQHRADEFFTYLRKNKRYKSLESFAQKAPWDQVLCMAYLMALDNIDDMSKPIMLADNAAQRASNSYAAQFVRAMLHAHNSLKTNWGDVYTIMNEVRNLSGVNEDITKAVRDNVFAYSDGYKPYATGEKTAPTISEQNETLANMFKNYNGLVTVDMLRAERNMLYDMLTPSDSILTEIQPAMAKIASSTNGTSLLDNLFETILDENLSLQGRLSICNTIFHYNPADYAAAYAYYLYQRKIIGQHSDIVNAISPKALACYYYFCLRKYPEGLDYMTFNMVGRRVMEEKSTEKSIRLMLMMAQINNALSNEDWCGAYMIFDDACNTDLMTERNVIDGMFAYDLFEYMHQCSMQCAKTEQIARKVFDAAMEKYDKRDYQSAYTGIGEALKLYQCPRFMYAKAIVSYLLNKDEEAIEALNYCLQENYNTAAAHSVMAEILQIRHKYAESIIHCDSALVSNPESLQVLFVRAINFSQMKKYKECINDYETMIKLRDKNKDFDFGTVYNNLAYTYMTIGQLEKAKAPALEALTLSYNKSYVLDTNGELQYRLGNYEKAVEFMNQAITIDSLANKNAYNSYYYRGFALMNLGRYAEAASDFKKVEHSGFPKVERMLKKAQKAALKSTSDAQFCYVVDNPNVLLNGDTGVRIKQVKYTDKYVVVTLSWTNNEYDSGVYSIKPEAYIVDAATNEKYQIFAAQNCTFSPYRMELKRGETAEFQLYFKAIPRQTKNIHFFESEDSSWKFFGIELKK